MTTNPERSEGASNMRTIEHNAAGGERSTSANVAVAPLPELPQRTTNMYGGEIGYTADQMHAYAREALAASHSAPGEGAMRDAYEGAREDLLDWKGRALRAEATLRGMGYSGVCADEPPSQPADKPAGQAVTLRPEAAPLTDAQVDRMLGAYIPGGSNARDWFLPHENDKALNNVRDVVRRMVGALAPEPATAGDETPSIAISDLLPLLPGTIYMDPPDGGSVSVLQQLQRMSGDARKWREYKATPSAVVPDDWRDDVSLAAQMLTWGWGDDGGLLPSQEVEIKAQQKKVFALLAESGATERCDLSPANRPAEAQRGGLDLFNTARLAASPDPLPAEHPAPSVPEGWVLVPDEAHMTDDQAEAIAKMANCCGGIAYDIYRVALAAAPAQGVSS